MKEELSNFPFTSKSKLLVVTAIEELKLWVALLIDSLTPNAALPVYVSNTDLLKNGVTSVGVTFNAKEAVCAYEELNTLILCVWADVI